MNYFRVREALTQAGRVDLIGGCEGVIPANPPEGAIEARRMQANRVAQGDDGHYHTVANPAKGEQPGERGAGPPKPVGYRPGRKTQQRRQGKKERQRLSPKIVATGPRVIGSFDSRLITCECSARCSAIAFTVSSR